MKEDLEACLYFVLAAMAALMYVYDANYGIETLSCVLVAILLIRILIFMNRTEMRRFHSPPKGSIIATCGHKLTDEEGLGFHAVSRDVDRTGRRAVRHDSMCTKCYRAHVLNSEDAIFTKTEEDIYLSGR